MKKTTFYLWEEKSYDENKKTFFITDYKEISKDGKVKIDNVGFLKLDLIHQSNNKQDLINLVNKKFNSND